ncbi:MAG: GNAT family N-acetyltransferase [Planctomycetes bacterium]|nr:GNAT family N-acetyltransferase [Planctomycetota bacterium]
MQQPQLGPLLAPVEAHWLFGSPLLGPGAPALLGQLLDDFAARGERPCVLVSGLPASAERRDAIAAVLLPRGRVRWLEPVVVCSASLDGGLDGWWSRRSGRFRRNLRQAERRAAAHGIGFERHVPRSAAESAAVYRRMLDVEQRSWKGIGRCGMAESPSREFYAAMLRRLAVAGAGRVVFARRGERDVGFVFGGMAGAVYRGQQFSFDDELAALSIGNLLQLEQLRWLVEERAERYDMGPRMQYKLQWTETQVVLDAWLLRQG